MYLLTYCTVFRLLYVRFNTALVVSSFLNYLLLKCNTWSTNLFWKDGAVFRECWRCSLPSALNSIVGWDVLLLYLLLINIVQPHLHRVIIPTTCRLLILNFSWVYKPKMDYIHQYVWHTIRKLRFWIWIKVGTWILEWRIQRFLTPKCEDSNQGVTKLGLVTIFEMGIFCISSSSDTELNCAWCNEHVTITYGNYCLFWNVWFLNNVNTIYTLYFPIPPKNVS